MVSAPPPQRVGVYGVWLHLFLAGATLGSTSGGVQALASLGRDGKWRANIERDLHNWCRKALGMNLDLSWIKIPVKSQKKGVVRWINHPVVFQHYLARAIWEAGPEQWKYSMLGFSGEDGLERFWQNAAKLDWAQGHPAFIHADALKIKIGYRTHGDAARSPRRMTNPLKVLNLTWQSVTTRGCSWDSRFIFTVIPTELLINKGPFENRTIHYLLKWFDAPHGGNLFHEADWRSRNQ